MVALEERSTVEEHFGVWPENWLAFTAFLAVSTQWRAIPRVDGTTYFQGLDYAAVDVGLSRAQIDTTPELWASIRVIEAAARNRLNGIMETS